MLLDLKRERREKRRLNALKRIEQIDKIIADLDGSAETSAGWCRGRLYWFKLIPRQIDNKRVLKVASCLVGAIEDRVVQEERTSFYRMLARFFLVRRGTPSRPRERLIRFNDNQKRVEPVLELLRNARARQMKLAGMVDV
jgi:hypothetical protein